MRKVIEINQNNNISWSKDVRLLEFNLDLTGYSEKVYIIFNWWEIDQPLSSKNNILLKNFSYIKLNEIGNSDIN